MSMHAMKRGRAALLALLAAVSFGLAAGCTEESPVQVPGGGEQEDGGGEEDD